MITKKTYWYEYISISPHYRCLDVIVSVNIDNVCHLHDTWDLTWTIKSSPTSSISTLDKNEHNLLSVKHIQGSKDGISCDLTFNTNDCFDIEIDYFFEQNNANDPFKKQQQPLSTILFLYDNIPLFRYSPIQNQQQYNNNRYTIPNTRQHNVCLNNYKFPMQNQNFNMGENTVNSNFKLRDVSTF